MPVFATESGHEVPSATTDEMREVDRIAVEGVELGMLQMVENAGRTLAGVVRQKASEPKQVIILAGGGGNGAGGLCATRHLRNHGWAARPLLDRDPTDLSGPASRQCRILTKSGVEVLAAGTAGADADASDTGLTDLLDDVDLLVDALVGYGLSGAPRGTTADLIEAVEASGTPVVSLDVPSGLLATTGETPGVAVSADVTLTLALPKTGLADDAEEPDLRPAVGDLLLGDIGIPPAVYRRAGFGPVVTTDDPTADTTDAGEARADDADRADESVDADNAAEPDHTADWVPYRQPFDGESRVRLVDVRR